MGSRNGKTHHVIICLLRLLQLLFEEKRDLLNIAAWRHNEDDAHRLAADLHDKPIENMAMLGPEGIQAVENDEPDVIVWLFDDEVYEAGCRS